MAFRQSPFIDFESGKAITHPMTLLKSRPKPRSLTDMLDLFQCRVEVWQLGPAVQILKMIQAPKEERWRDAAYALLAVTFTYFEMVGKSLNQKSKPAGTAGDDFNAGFCDVYPEFSQAPLHVKAFRDRVRNGIYHLGYTKNNLLIHNHPPLTSADFFVDTAATPPVYYVNPEQMTLTIVEHFQKFMGRLRDANNRNLRETFRRFFEEYHA
jgi:hypothetical protein